MEKMPRRGEDQATPLAQVEDLEELKRRYSGYDDATLRRWMEAVKGSHRAAMEALLKDRGAL